MADKHLTCRHSTGRAGELAVYVKQSCPAKVRIHGRSVSSKMRCENCKYWIGKE